MQCEDSQSCPEWITANQVERFLSSPASSGSSVRRTGDAAWWGVGWGSSVPIWHESLYWGQHLHSQPLLNTHNTRHIFFFKSTIAILNMTATHDYWHIFRHTLKLYIFQFRHWKAKATCKRQGLLRWDFMQRLYSLCFDPEKDTSNKAAAVCPGREEKRRKGRRKMLFRIQQEEEISFCTYNSSWVAASTQ